MSTFLGHLFTIFEQSTNNRGCGPKFELCVVPISAHGSRHLLVRCENLAGKPKTLGSQHLVCWNLSKSFVQLGCICVSRNCRIRARWTWDVHPISRFRKCAFIALSTTPENATTQKRTDYIPFCSISVITNSSFSKECFSLQARYSFKFLYGTCSLFLYFGK